MPPDAGPTVVIGREVDRLGVPRRMAAEDAVQTGVLTRRKVEGIWLYARSIEHIDNVTDSIGRAAGELCSEWLLGSMRIVAGKVAKDSGAVTMEATRPLVRWHIRQGNLGALPALTAEHQPHLFLHAPVDAAEVERIIGAAQHALSSVGVLDADDVPDTERPRSSRAWRYSVLGHLEWLGLGGQFEGTLSAWGAP